MSTPTGQGRLAGKTVAITGAAHGIGRAYAERCAREGAFVVLCDVDGPALERVMQGIRDDGGDGSCAQVDVRDYPSVKAWADEAARLRGRIDGLVNNAGMLNVFPVSRVMFEDIPEAEWDLVFNENTKSVWYCCRAFVPHMRDGKGGSIVNIASSTVFRAVETRAHYVASKAAVLGFTRVLARELGKDWIRVNVIAPGSTLSEEDPSPETVAMREVPVKQRALKRVERPADLVGTCVHLLSDDSAFVTGQTFVVEGGGILR